MSIDPETIGLPNEYACIRLKCVWLESYFDSFFQYVNYLTVAKYPDQPFQVKLRQANMSY